MLICAEGARLLENAIAFSSCVGRIEEVIQCPAGGRDRGDPAGALAPRRLTAWSTKQQPSLTQPIFRVFNGNINGNSFVRSDCDDC
jgi:hypothetical protein